MNNLGHLHILTLCVFLLGLSSPRAEAFKRSAYLQGEIVTSKRVHGRIEKKSQYIGFPSELSLHSGTYHALRVKGLVNAHFLKISLSPIPSPQRKKEIKSFPPISLEPITFKTLNFDFDLFFAKNLTQVRKGSLSFKVLDKNKKVIYQFNSLMTMEEL